MKRSVMKPWICCWLGKPGNRGETNFIICNEMYTQVGMLPDPCNYIVRGR